MLDLAVFERDAEAFCRALSRERYLYGAGLQATLDLAPLYDDFTWLFRDDAYGELLEAELEPKPKRYLLDFVASGYLDDHARTYTERLAAMQAAATVVWLFETAGANPSPTRMVNAVVTAVFGAAWFSVGTNTSPRSAAWTAAAVPVKV